MNNYNYNGDFIRRSRGRSFIGCLAYISRRNIVRETTNVLHKTSLKDDHFYGEMALPEGMGDSFLDIEYLANYVEDFEDRMAHERFKGHPTDPVKNAKSRNAAEAQKNNAQAGYTSKFALPHDLSKEDQIAICREFADFFRKEGFVVRWDIHDSGDGNPHCHMAMPLRRWDKETNDLSRIKERKFFNKANLKTHRKILDEIINRKFVEKDINLRWRCESYKDMGLNITPTKHDGYYARKMDADGRESRIVSENKRVRDQNILRFLKDPEILLKKIASYRRYLDESVFKGDIARELLNDEERIVQFYAAMRERVKGQEKDKKAKLPVKVMAAILDEDNIEAAPVVYGEIFDGYVRQVDEDIEESIHFANAALIEKTKAARDQAKDSLAEEQGADNEPLIPEGYKFDFTKYMNSLIAEKAVFSRDEIESDLHYQMANDVRIIDVLKEHLNIPDIQYGQLKAVDAKTSQGAVLQDGVLDENEVLDLELSYIARKATDAFLTFKGIVEIHKDEYLGSTYTTEGHAQKEQRIFDHVKNLNKARDYHTFKRKPVYDHLIYDAIKAYNKKSKFKLNKMQEDAVFHFCQNGTSLRCLSGKAGTGKTTVMRLVADLYDAQDYRVRGVSFQGSAVEVLEADIDKPCQTIDSLIRQWRLIDAYDQGLKTIDEDIGGGVKKVTQLKPHTIKAYREKSELKANDVIIVDEANMVGSHLWAPLLERADRAGAIVLVTGDRYQAKARGKGDVHRGIEEESGYLELTEIVRQEQAYAKQASHYLADHDFEPAFDLYEEHNCIQWFETKAEALSAQARDFANSFLYNADQKMIAPSFKNIDVEVLNREIREHLIEAGYLQANSSRINGNSWSKHDKIIFLKPDIMGIT
jgi:hypothetical protein